MLSDSSHFRWDAPCRSVELVGSTIDNAALEVKWASAARRWVREVQQFSLSQRKAAGFLCRAPLLHYTKNEHKDLPCALPYVPPPPEEAQTPPLKNPSPSLMEPRMPLNPIVNLVQDKLENQGTGWRAVTRPTILIFRNWKLNSVAAKLFPKT